MEVEMIQMLSETGEKQYPVTSSEAVGMSDGSGNLDTKLAELDNKTESNIQPFFRKGIISSISTWYYDVGHNHILIPNNSFNEINYAKCKYIAFLKSDTIEKVDFCDGYETRLDAPLRNQKIPSDCKYIYAYSADYSDINIIIDDNDIFTYLKNKYNIKAIDEDIKIKSARTYYVSIYPGLINTKNIWDSDSSGYYFIIIPLKKGNKITVKDSEGLISLKKYAILSEFNISEVITGTTPKFIQNDGVELIYPDNLVVNQDCYIYLSCNEDYIPNILIDGVEYFIVDELHKINSSIKKIDASISKLNADINGELPVYDGLISQNNVWNTATGYKFTLVKCNKGDIITATGDSSLKKYALLKTIPSQPIINNDSPDYIDSESSVHLGYPSELEVPENCYLYLQVSNSDGTVYLPTVLINGHGLGFEDRLSNLESKFNNNNLEAEKASIYLPEKIYVTSGIIIELYNRQVAYCQNYKNFFFDWDCQVIKKYNDKIRIEATDTNSGEYKLTLKLYDYNFKLIETKESTIIIKKKNSNTNFNTLTKKKILAISDSYGTRREWYVEMRKLFREISNSGENDVVEFVGTQKTADNDYHEGYNGYRMDQFCTGGYASNVDVVVSGITTPPQDGTSKVQYSCSVYKPNGQLHGTNIYEVETAETHLSIGEDGLYSGTIRLNVVSGTSYQAFLPSNGTLTKVNSEVGDDTIQFSSWDSTEGNPFYIDGKLDFNAYCINNGIFPDLITLSVGTNLCKNLLNLSYTDDYVGTDYTPLYIKYFIDALRATEYDDSVGIDWSTIPIVIGHKPNTGDFIRERETRLRYYSIAVNTEKLLEGYDKIYFVPFNIEVDSEHDFTTGITEPVNPRQNEITMVVNNQDVHPQLPGYYQMADGYVSCIYEVVD